METSAKTGANVMDVGSGQTAEIAVHTVGELQKIKLDERTSNETKQTHCNGVVWDPRPGKVVKEEARQTDIVGIRRPLNRARRKHHFWCATVRREQDRFVVICCLRSVRPVIYINAERAVLLSPAIDVWIASKEVFRGATGCGQHSESTIKVRVTLVIDESKFKFKKPGELKVTVKVGTLLLKSSSKPGTVSSRLDGNDATAVGRSEPLQMNS